MAVLMLCAHHLLSLLDAHTCVCVCAYTINWLRILINRARSFAYAVKTHKQFATLHMLRMFWREYCMPKIDTEVWCGKFGCSIAISVDKVPEVFAVSFVCGKTANRRVGVCVDDMRIRRQKSARAS